MKIINQSHEIISFPENALETIEDVARTCYKSEGKKGPGSAEKIVRTLVDKGHHAMIEFGTVIVKFITNRGVTHELVRHRLCSFAQESTRYVRYDGTMEFIRPVWCSDDVLIPGDFARLRDPAAFKFCTSLSNAERDYQRLLAFGWRPEQAREVLPNALKTEINVMGNLREWRHIFEMRCQKAAHPQIRALMLPVLAEFSERIPVIFEDLAEKFLKEGE